MFGAVALVVAAVLLVAGCGGGGSSSSDSSSSSGTSSEFRDPAGGKEPIATFGEEAEEDLRGEVSEVLAENLAARENADFATQCATLGVGGMKVIFGKEGVKASECQAKLEQLAKPLLRTKGFRVDTLSGEIAALRVKGDQAYALYHGNDGKDYAMPMEEEDGEWKVGALVTIELPQAKPEAAKKPKKKEA